MASTQKRRRFGAAALVAITVVVGVAYGNLRATPSDAGLASTGTVQGQLAAETLDRLAVKGRAPKAGYSRGQFGGKWAESGACDMRNRILARDLTDVTVRSDTDCTVLSGVLQQDPYTGKRIAFARGASTSQRVQIDHVVAVSDAWQKGAQQLSAEQRADFYNDPLNLLAVDGPANSKKGDGDAATWLPPDKPYRCRYVARQIAVKARYRLWVTKAERNAMRRVLHACPGQILPLAAGNGRLRAE